jgi:cellulose synthase/poly-beta-1,6-N-acetylglucosamine synthase-like glycosyltransferase/beta-mannanase
MSKANKIIAPTKKEKITLRLMIFLGLLCLVNFFYWFLDPGLVEDRLLYWLLVISIAYETLKIFYIWYHYWDISIPQKPAVTQKLSVDVFTTYFPGEPYEIVKKTLFAIQKMEYPHCTYLCDEANDPYLKSFCEENSIIHVTRNNRINAKAGNINNALLQAKGDICLILDPDHIPLSNFLEVVIPYFEDPTIGFVQTVQSYYNISESLVAQGAAEQTFHFYGPVMMGMNSYGTVNAIGANCVFRRKALDSIGGHAPGLAEDMHTGMQLHAKGWKSVYVPRVLTKGLAPASLTSYYKQQLKWSRGTLELLFMVYPKLYTKFTWRQKIHYGILPFHYISGITYLINFLIPIISLFTATTPWKGNVVNFGSTILPIFICGLGILFYMQVWVMYKSERGIHLIGGLLQMCTWWINCLGFIYTIIRKKIPYLPTPKEDKESTNWKILMPNLLVGIISIIAVIYGLSIDLTPFSLFMSGFAILNAIFMFYTLVFAYQKPKIIPVNYHSPDKSSSIVNRLRNLGFQICCKFALPIIVLVLATSITIQHDIQYVNWGVQMPEIHRKHPISYLGVFAPQNDNGITNLKNAQQISHQIDKNLDIVSFYLAWGKNIDFPQSLLDSIYLQKSLPMITWEPWLDSMELKLGKPVYDLIEEGYFDPYITRFAVQLKNLQKPVFLRFAHEFDNPFYPWYVNGNNASLRFKKAWIHTCEIFKNNHATNVIWIWNPWKSDNVAEFYPGDEYVDWIGIDILNYGKLNQDGKWHNFKDLYQPFHEQFKNLPAAPIIISEFGSLKNEPKQNEWLENAFVAIENDFKEIKSVVFFNSKFDHNWPNGVRKKEYLDWTIPKIEGFKYSFISQGAPKYVLSSLPNFSSRDTAILPLKSNELKNIRGINLKKGPDWRKDFHVLSRKNLLSDFEKIKRLGIHTIRYAGNSIYDYNVLNIARACDLNVSYGFWIAEDIDFVNDTLKTNQLKQDILDQLVKQKHCAAIISWNIQNDIQSNQKKFYNKPALLYQNRAYINWLKTLVKAMKEIDSRPVIVDLEIDNQSIYHSRMLNDNVVGIDALGLVVKDDKYLNSLISHFKKTNTQFVYSEIKVDNLIKPEIFDSHASFFVTSWQDQYESNKLTFDGLLDRKGRYKTDYFTLLNALQKSNTKINNPKIRILRPATPMYRFMNYHAMCYDSMEGWKQGGAIKDLNFEWSLIKCDSYGNYQSIKSIGYGASVTIKRPQNHEFYRLLLETTKGKTITTTITTLNTPLIRKNEIFK